MKRSIALSVAAGMGLLALVPTMAMAHTDVSVGVNVGQPGYVEPVPVVEYREVDRHRYRHDDNYRRMMDQHYRQHNEWVRNHPGEGGRIERPPWR
jgi:hypothetical protein